MQRAVLLLASLSLVVLLASGVASAALRTTADTGTVQVEGGPVSAVLVAGERVYLGGNFTHVNGVPRHGLAAVDAATGALTDWNPGANGPVLALAASPDGTRVYAGGSFTSVAGADRERLAAVDAATGAAVPWKARANRTVYALAASGRRIYVGGEFTKLNGKRRTRLGLVDGPTGALNRNWAPAANGAVRALAASPTGGRLYAGGDFGAISGKPGKYLAALDTRRGAKIRSWKPRNPNGRVLDLAVSGGRVFTGEAGLGGAAAAYGARSGAKAWSVKSDGDVQAIAVMAGKVYAGGHFVEFAGQSRKALAAVDASTGALDAQWAPSASPGFPGVLDLAGDSSRGRLYAGGGFQKISGENRAGFAQFSEE